MEERDLFTQSAWFLYEHREQILADPHMAYAPIDMQNGLMYLGTLQDATLGVYVEWWDRYANAQHTDEQGMEWLMVHFHGSPLSGMNWCQIVNRNGDTKEWHVPGFNSLTRGVVDLCRSFAKTRPDIKPYTLAEVLERLQ